MVCQALGLPEEMEKDSWEDWALRGIKTEGVSTLFRYLQVSCFKGPLFHVIL